MSQDRSQISPLESGDSEALLRSADRLIRHKFERRYQATPTIRLNFST